MIGRKWPADGELLPISAMRFLSVDCLFIQFFHDAERAHTIYTLHKYTHKQHSVKIAARTHTFYSSTCEAEC